MASLKYYDKTTKEWKVVGYPDSSNLFIDESLTHQGQAADAKAVGEALSKKQPIGSYLTEVPEDYATKEYVQEKIAEAQLEGEDIDLSLYALKTDIPDQLSDLQEDDTHKFVTKAEKEAWNAKSNFSGAYSDLTGKPTLGTMASKNSITKSDLDSSVQSSLDKADSALQQSDISNLATQGYVTEQISKIPTPDVSDQIGTHNAATDAHNDIRKSIKNLEDNKLSTTELTTAINNALDQAKQSGEFDGDNGISATHSWNGTILSITSASGTSSANLKGEKGDKGDTGDTGPAGADGAKGEKGDRGEQGLQGPKGDTGATGAPGKDGKTPVKGTDYFTADDKAEMVEAVKNAYSSDTSWLEGYDIPKLYLTGDTTGMSKDVAVTLSWVYGENSGSCTLKWQGNSSLAYDKKNYTIKLDNAIDIGYGTQKKYVLKANYIDFSHARNIVSARIWGMMVASRKNIIGKLASSPNYGAVNGFPVAIMLNGEFHGLYTFNIPKDGWMMNMGSGTQECILCADHSTATQFKGEATLVGETDFEIEYITDENNTAWAKTSVNRLINACINSNGGDLDTTIAKYLDWESAIDYYILVALLDGPDMTDKNYILATYDGVKWFFSAYDMDSTYGLKWDGSYFSKASYGDQTSFAAYATKHRLMELIKRFKTNALKARYAELRADVLSESTIAREFERFACSIPSRLLDEDRNIWPMLPLTSVNNTFQILCWLNRRLPFVDKWMEELSAQEEPPKATYTNQVPISTDDSGAVYNGVGYKDGYRLSGLASGNGTEKAAEGSVLTGYIPVPDNTAVIRIKGVQLVDQNTLHCYVSTYDANKQKQGYTTYDSWLSSVQNHYELVYDEATGVYTITFGSSAIASQWTRFIRLNAYGKGADMIVTVNEEIT